MPSLFRPQSPARQAGPTGTYWDLHHEPYGQSVWSCTSPAFTGFWRIYWAIFSSCSSERDQ